MTYAALILQGLFFVPQVRHAVAQWLPPSETSGESEDIRAVSPPSSGSGESLMIAIVHRLVDPVQRQ